MTITENAQGYFRNGKHLCNLRVHQEDNGDIKLSHCGGGGSSTLMPGAFRNLGAFERAARFHAARYKHRPLIFDMNGEDFEALIEHCGFELFYQPDSQSRPIGNIDDRSNSLKYPPFSRIWCIRIGRRLKEQDLSYNPETMSVERFNQIIRGRFSTRADLDTPLPSAFTTHERSELEKLNRRLELNERALYAAIVETGDLGTTYHYVLDS
jgi:hypothetical protein